MFEKVLGAGAFGQVIAATQKEDNLPVRRLSLSRFVFSSVEHLLVGAFMWQTKVVPAHTSSLTKLTHIISFSGCAQICT